MVLRSCCVFHLRKTHVSSVYLPEQMHGHVKPFYCSQHHAILKSRNVGGFWDPSFHDLGGQHLPYFANVECGVKGSTS